MEQLIRVNFGDRTEGEVEALVRDAMESHPAGKGVSELDRARLEARKWSARIDIAREAYAEALSECRRLGLSNVEIARTVGKSEAAIRMHLKRRNRT